MLERVTQSVPPALLDPRGVAAGRTLVGLSMVARPGLIPGLLGVESPVRTRMAWVTQMLGAREIALGAGALANPDQPRWWLLAGLLSDTVDAVVVGKAVLRGQVHPVTGLGLVAIATGAAVAQVQALKSPQLET